MSTQIIPTEKEALNAFDKLDPQIKQILVAANELTVTNEEESNHAATFLGDLKSELDTLEDRRKELTVGMNKVLKIINNSAKLRSEPLKQADRIVKGKLAKYLDEQERIKEEERRQAEAEKEAREEEARRKLAAAKSEAAKKKAAEEVAKVENEVVEVEAAPTSVRTESGMVSRKKIWKFEVMAVSKIPEHFMIPDKVAINKAIADGNRNIEGLRIYQETVLATRV